MNFTPRAMRITRWLATAASMAVLVGGAGPVLAQDSNTNARLSKVESEVRALQRKVFPGGDGRAFEPQITAPATPTPLPGQPASTPVTDLLNRMGAVETQMAQLTAQVEQNTNRIAQLEAKLAAAMPQPPVEAAPAGAAAPQANLDAMTGGAATSPSRPAATPSRPVTPPATSPAAPPARPAAASSARVEAVRAIAKPQTSDAGDDEYSYGYRLWEAKFYPEAQQQLKLFLTKYPRHARASWGRNLLGRAYLDDGNPSEAAKWFLQNFQTDKRGDRAADSLLYLAVSMKQLKDTKRACIALAEFSETYPAESAGRLASLYNSTRSGLSCS
ncbi:tetratricopeptide repeat protein [Novosphingobium soli]|uniref:Tol-pal system YbgF family protein n=1 Tax=Novosphingobium soli TaxID=574956 RepID=A0ABV6CUY0_9SPHN